MQDIAAYRSDSPSATRCFLNPILYWASDADSPTGIPVISACTAATANSFISTLNHQRSTKFFLLISVLYQMQKKPSMRCLLKQGRKAEKPAGKSQSRLPKLRRELARKTDYDCKPINPHRVFAELNSYFGDNAIFTTGCGITQIWSGQLQDIDSPRHYLPSGGAGCLGYDIPAAFGAYAATGKQTVAVMGDFGFTFHVQELAVCAKNNIPVIVVVVNNAYLGLIRQNQKYAYGYEYAVEMAENQEIIDYVTVAKGFACYSERVFEPGEIGAALKRAQESGKPAVIDIVCDPVVDCSMGTAAEQCKRVCLLISEMFWLRNK